jgi:hypothetical protein
LPIFFARSTPQAGDLTRNLENIDELWLGYSHTSLGIGWRGAMLNKAIDYAGCDDDRRRLQRASALLEMFEEYRGRRAATVEELRDWMGRQYTDQLQMRMNRRLHGIDTGILRFRKKSPVLAEL